MIRAIFVFVFALAQAWGAGVALPDDWVMKLSPASVWLLIGPIADPEPYIVTVDDRAVRESKQWGGEVTFVDMRESLVEALGLPRKWAKRVQLDVSRFGTRDVITYHVLSVDGAEAVVRMNRYGSGNGSTSGVVRIKAVLYEDGCFHLTRMPEDDAASSTASAASAADSADCESPGEVDSQSQDPASGAQDGKEDR
ncbi:MAG: hypothetical protein ACOCWR_07095 [Oceanidesulfovibrio sp.]